MRALSLALAATLVACSSSDANDSSGNTGAGAGGSGAAGSAGSGAGVAGAAGGATTPTYGPAEVIASDLFYGSRTVLLSTKIVVTESPQPSADMGSIAVVAKEGGALQRVSTPRPTAMVGRGGDEVWLAHGSPVNGGYFVSKFDPSAVTLTKLFPVTDPSRELVNGDAGQLGALSLAGPTSPMFVYDATGKLKAEAPFEDTGLVLFFQGAYLVGDGKGQRIARVDAASGAVTTWATGVSHPYAMAVHGGDVVVADEDVDGKKTGRIVAFAGDGQTGTMKGVLAEGMNEVLRMASFAGELYWTESGDCATNPGAMNGTIYRLTADAKGGPPMQLTGQACPRGIAVDETGIYWVSRGANGAGSVWRSKRTN